MSEASRVESAIPVSCSKPNDEESWRERLCKLCSKDQNNVSDTDRTCSSKKCFISLSALLKTISSFLRLRSLPFYIVDTTFALGGSILQQATLPNVRPMSTRFLLWGWSLTVLVLTSYYKGSLTADKIQPSPPTPFTTFEEILAAKDFLFCMPSDYVTYISSMQFSDKDSVMHRLYQRMPHLRKNIPGYCNTMDEVATFLMSGAKVLAIGIRDDLKRVVLSRNITDIVFLKEDLVSTAVGMPFPKDSQLVQLFSFQLQLYIEQGIVEFVYNKWGGLNKTAVSAAETRLLEGAEDRAQIQDTVWLFYWCAVGIVASAAVLIGEYVVTFAVIRLRLHTDTTS